MRTKSIFIVITVLTIILCIFFVWKLSYRSELVALHDEAQQKLVQVVDQFTGQISTARILPTLIARNSEVISSLEQGEASDVVIENLERTRDLTRAHDIQLIDTNGNQLFSTSNENHNQNIKGTEYFKRAMQGSLGVQVRYAKSENTRTLAFARSVINGERRQVGVVVLELELETLESEFRARPEIVMFLNSSGTVVFSNRAKSVFQLVETYPSTLLANALGPVTTLGSMLFTDDAVTNQAVNESELSNGSIWEALTGNPKINYLVVRKPILTIGLESVLFIDTASALWQAKKITSLVAAIILLTIVTAIAIFQRRRRFVERLEAEQKLTSELDRRVALRSAELERAQNELVQSAKLSALGKMSLGISHELNQPVASIQNFSVNAMKLLASSRTEETLENLKEIETQTVRMSRIISNLRDFSRRDALPSEPVDICKIIRDVLRMLDHRIQQEGAYISTTNTEHPVFVVGGQVRLQQVFTNLIANALDAVKFQQDKHIRIALIQPSDNSVKIRVQDNGPGLSDPSRIFEPFYTTKTGEDGDGLGLGLSIAYGFVESFGGSLRATNSEDGGALLTLILSAAENAVDDSAEHHE